MPMHNPEIKIPSSKREVVCWQQNVPARREKQLAVEMPVSILLNGKLLLTIMALPLGLKELATGLLASERLIAGREDLIALAVEENEGKRTVVVETSGRSLPLGPGIVTSGCGKGMTFTSPTEFDKFEPVQSDLQISCTQLSRLMKRMLDRDSNNGQVDGLHAAAICTTEEMISFQQDLGRHNAVDKVVGDCLLRGMTTQGKILLTTGRISSEMMMKAVRAQIPIVGSLTSPTDLALRLAEAMDVTTIGYMRGNRMVVYAGGHRLVTQAAGLGAT
jgi:FdhD protein